MSFGISIQSICLYIRLTSPLRVIDHVSTKHAFITSVSKKNWYLYILYYQFNVVRLK